jgi:hypothetical protein
LENAEKLVRKVEDEIRSNKRPCIRISENYFEAIYLEIKLDKVFIKKEVKNGYVDKRGCSY